MARRRTSTAIVRTIPVRAPAPVIRVSAPRAPSHKKHHRRRHHGVGGGLSSQGLMAVGIGGAVVGFVDKSIGASLPTIPLLGRKGTLAIGLYFFTKGKSGLLRDAAVAAASIAGYELGNTGKISGVDGDVMGPVPQVSGIAAQV